MAMEIPAQIQVLCPSCGRKSKRVSPVTLRALLKEEHASEIVGGEPSCCSSEGHVDTDCQPLADNTGWRFCDATDCDVVYFSQEGNTTFSKSQLKVPVGVKETAGERPLCYCFGHSVASIKDELHAKGRSTALADIRAKMKDPGCRCETENPSGSCCLGSVAQGTQMARDELGIDDRDPPVLPASGNMSTGRSPTGRGEKIAKIGTLLAAVMASSCCWLPLVLLAVGVSGAGIASTLEAYRPLFMVVTFSFLGAAFYYTYRPKKAAAARGHDCCAAEPASEEDCCASAAKGRSNMLALNKVMLWVVTVMAVAFLLFPSYVGAFLGGDGGTVTATMSHSVFAIEGMTCEGCSSIVAKAIRGVPGVLAVEVSYADGQTVVGTEASRTVPKEKLLVAIESVGYHGTFVPSEGNDKNATLAK